jgi:DNA-binding response OmpR family regulator
MPQLLLASPDEVVLQALGQALATDGHTTLNARTLSEARRALSRLEVGALCLDMSFHRSETAKFWQWLRSDADHRSLPALLLAPRSARVADGLLPVTPERDRDAVLAKPLDRDEVRQEMGRLLSGARRRRRGGQALRVGPLRLRPELREVSSTGGGSVRLTPTEFRLLRYLMERPRDVVSTDELLEKVWGYAPETAGPEIIRAHIRNLRAKMRLAGFDPGTIHTLPGHGYSLATR